MKNLFITLLAILSLQISSVSQVETEKIDTQTVSSPENDTLLFNDNIPMAKVDSNYSLKNSDSIIQKPEVHKPKAYHAIYLELAGPSLLYSVNYEHIFILKHSNNNINLRLGIMILPAVFLMPVGIAYDIGKKKNKLEINLSRCLNFTPEDDFDQFTSLGMAYVRRPLDGFYFRFSCLFIVFDETANFLGSRAWFLPGISFGHSF